MIRAILEKSLKGECLTKDEAQNFIELVVAGAETHQVAAILALLRRRGETAEEISGMVQGMLRHVTPVETKCPVLDIVGTGGDCAQTINLSTGAAFTAAACGVPVAKHGNRAVSSLCGSADLLEELGICLHQSPEAVGQSIEQYSFGFMFAPSFHPAMKMIAPVRQKLKIRTVFNFLGPLLNPSRAAYRLVGVYDPDLIEPIAAALQQLGVVGAFVFHGSGLDELTPIGKAEGVLVHDGCLRPYTVDPKVLGIEPCAIQDLRGGDAKENARLLKNIFLGEDGPISDAIALNAGCGMWIYGNVKTLAEGVYLAKEVLRSGKAFSLLQSMRRAREVSC